MHVLFHFAYLDAGTGSLIIQAVVGAVAGVAVFGRRLIWKVRSGVMKLLGKQPPQAPTTYKSATPPASDTKNPATKPTKKD